MIGKLEDRLCGIGAVASPGAEPMGGGASL